MIKPDSPSISVIIPTHNRANTITNCINSVLSQSYSVNEIIVVDDCSSDDTVKLLSSINGRIKFIRNDTQLGAQASRNVGIKAAKSDWIAFLDSDDEWLPDKLQKQISALSSVDYNPLTVVHGDCYINNSKSDNKIWNLDKIDGDNVYKKLLSKSGTLFPAIITSKHALKKINYLDEDVPSFQEWDTSISLAEYCRFIHIQEPLFTYNIHNDSISNDSTTSIEGYKYIIEKHKKDIKKFCSDTAYNKHLLICSTMALNSGQYNNSRIISKQILGINVKKYILLLFSFIKFKPIYIIKTLQRINGKRN